MRIAIDAGHGTNTAGKRTPPIPVNIDYNGDGIIDIKKGTQFREHYANVFVATLLAKELERCGFETFKTGFNDNDPTDDADTSLTDRQKAIAKADCDYSISIHYNAYGDGNTFNTAEGIGIYIHDKYINQSEKLAKIVLKHLVQGSVQKDRGVTKSALAMCNCNNLDVKGAILVELAFMTNLREATELMASDNYWKESAIEIAKGLCEYVGKKYIEESNTPTKTITIDSSKEDIKWLQDRLNKALPNESNIPLIVDGIYGNKTRIAVLIYWEKLGWNKDGSADGWRAGAKTINKLV